VNGKAAPAPPQERRAGATVLEDSILFDNPCWPLQILELAMRGVMEEAKENRLDSDDVTRMTEPLFALAYDARRAAIARETGR
jgi:hypothetical protein